MDPYLKEKIENWAGDFLGSDRILEFPGPVQERAPSLLPAFLIRACEARGRGPDDLEEPDVRAGLLEGASRVAVAEAGRREVPSLCAAFLEELEAQGRLGGGRALAAFLRALRPAWLEASAGKPATIVRPAAKVGRNDPCPCGSGRKYKKCCWGLLDRG